MSNKIVVIYSGGMDSYTMLMNYRAAGRDVHAVLFNYGQRHLKELEYAMKVAEGLGIPHKVVNMSKMGWELLGGSSQTDKSIPVPEGHYEDETMRLTVVPNRNMIMLSMAIGYAVSIGAGTVAYGAHSGDHAIYPDCRREFVDAMNAVAQIANYQPVKIEAPFQDLSKGEIAEIGKDLGLDYSKAWTCYNGRAKPCGKCGACQERIEAMEYAGIEDPLEYE